MYLISEIQQRDDVISLVVKELRQIGINASSQNSKVAHVSNLRCILRRIFKF